MRASIIIRFFTIIWLLGYASPLAAQVLDPLDSAIINCLKSKSVALGIDIIPDLMAHERYMVSEGYLKNHESASYYAFFKVLSETGDIDIYRDYSNHKSIDSLSKEDFGACYQAFRDTEIFRKSKSKYKDLVLEMDQVVQIPFDSDKYNPVKQLAEVYVRALDENDFENPILKYSALYFFYFASFDIKWKD